MRLAMMMAIQTVAGPPIPVEMRPVKPTPVATPCNQPDAQGDIVICARPSSANRLERMDPDRYAATPLRAATTVGKARLVAEAEQGVLPNGQSSPRAMLRLKLPF